MARYPANADGVVYLIHFDRPWPAGKHPQHYCGWAADLTTRITAHRRGYGSKLCSLMNAAGIGWDVVRTWEGRQTWERRLKNIGRLAASCPVCNPETWKTNGVQR